jgi:glycosyltransferase involved in cell wall biosynthesis
MYFHGHSVGGTNPSLLEAMGCRCLIVAHDNEFNRSVLSADAFYFKDSDDIARLMESVEKSTSENKILLDHNYHKIQTDYTWPKIVEQYEQVLTKL